MPSNDELIYMYITRAINAFCERVICKRHTSNLLIMLTSDFSRAIIAHALATRV